MLVNFFMRCKFGKNCTAPYHEKRFDSFLNYFGQYNLDRGAQRYIPYRIVGASSTGRFAGRRVTLRKYFER